MTLIVRLLVVAVFAITNACAGESGVSRGVTTPTSSTGANYVPNWLAKNLHFVTSGLDQEGEDMRVELRDIEGDVRRPYVWTVSEASNPQTRALPQNTEGQALLNGLTAGTYTVSVLTQEGRTGILPGVVVKNRTVYKSIDLPIYRQGFQTPYRFTFAPERRRGYWEVEVLGEPGGHLINGRPVSPTVSFQLDRKQGNSIVSTSKEWIEVVVLGPRRKIQIPTNGTTDGDATGLSLGSRSSSPIGVQEAALARFVPQ